MRLTLSSNIIVAFLLYAAVPAPVLGQGFSTVGHASANFLKIPVEPVGASLGNSLVASAEGVLGLYWNPGALAFTEGTEILFSRMNWIGDTRISFAGLARNIGPGAIGLSITALTMDDMEITTELQPNGTGERFSSGSYAVGLSWGMKIIDRFSFGGTVKYVHEYIWETRGSTYAFDFGSVYTTDFHRMRIGMRIANFGGDMIFSGSPIDSKPDAVGQSGISYSYDPRLDRVAEESPLPQTFNVGISIEPLQFEGHRITLTAAVNDPNDNVTQMEYGGEYSWNETVSVRAGYKTGFDEQSISGGIGLQAPLAGTIVRVDFAYAGFGQLGSVGVISLRLGF